MKFKNLIKKQWKWIHLFSNYLLVLTPIWSVRTLDEQQLAEVIDAMFEHKVKKDEMVIKQGDDGDYFYVIETGAYSALINTDAGQKIVFR